MQPSPESASLLHSVVRRNALLARAIVRLEGVVVDPIGTVTGLAPGHVTRAERSRWRSRIGRLRGNSTTDYRAGAEGSQREPVALIVAVATAIVGIAAIATIPAGAIGWAISRAVPRIIARAIAWIVARPVSGAKTGAAIRATAILDVLDVARFLDLRQSRHLHRLRRRIATCQRDKGNGGNRYLLKKPSHGSSISSWSTRAR